MEQQITSDFTEYVDIDIVKYIWDNGKSCRDNWTFLYKTYIFLLWREQ